MCRARIAYSVSGHQAESARECPSRGRCIVSEVMPAVTGPALSYLAQTVSADFRGGHTVHLGCLRCKTQALTARSISVTATLTKAQHPA